MIYARCGHCHTELFEPGAVVTSPPTPVPAGQDWASEAQDVVKIHLCVTCFTTLVPWLSGGMVR